MTTEDRAALTAALSHSREVLLAALEGDDESWYRKEGDGWSVAEVMEHLWITEFGVSKVVLPRLLSGPPAEGPSPRSDSFLMERTRDRSSKIAAPERVTPKNAGMARQQSIERFLDLRAQLSAFVDTVESDLRSFRSPHPVFGPVDGCQWILLVAAHMERHAAQITQLKSA